uniref:Bm3820 n=1 Tax=Parascaris univalens TaxID=6257 RepID=A0A915BYD0_PARUN
MFHIRVSYLRNCCSHAYSLYFLCPLEIKPPPLLRAVSRGRGFVPPPCNKFQQEHQNASKTCSFCKFHPPIWSPVAISEN